MSEWYSPVVAWFSGHARDLPWRHRDVSPWGVLMSEIMLQQTPVVRVEPVWRGWMERWPTPAALAGASVADAITAWGRLGYPRRALRLHACAVAITDDYEGSVPDDEALLRTLPGVGDYTAAAIAAFAFGRRALVLDTNIRRVLARAQAGQSHPAPCLTRAERERAAALLPEEAAASATWNAAIMELGALVCTARNPACDACPLAATCAWIAAGRPADQYLERRRRQPWQGTDRQLRGRIMALLRAQGQVAVAALPGRLAAVARADTASPDITARDITARETETRETNAIDTAGVVTTPIDMVQLDRCMQGLIDDGLASCPDGTHLSLPPTGASRWQGNTAGEPGRRVAR